MDNVINVVIALLIVTVTIVSILYNVMIRRVLRDIDKILRDIDKIR